MCDDDGSVGDGGKARITARPFVWAFYRADGVSLSDSSRFGYLAANAPCTVYYWDPSDSNDRYRPPDAGPSVAWADRALKAIILQDWIWLTWQLTASAYVISLH